MDFERLQPLSEDALPSERHKRDAPSGMLQWHSAVVSLDALRSGYPEEATMDEDRFNIDVRKFLKEVGVTSQREIERVVREGQVKGGTLKLRMTLTAENTPLQHVIERTIKVEDKA